MADTYGRAVTETPRPTDDRPPKSVLICPSCGHENPVDGDWDVHTERVDGREHHVYTCPDCGAELTSRPVFAVSTP